MSHRLSTVAHRGFRALAACATALVLFSAVQAAGAAEGAGEQDSNVVFPASVPNEIAALRSQPSQGTFHIPFAPGTQPLTETLLANYIERQNALQAFDGFYTGATPGNAGDVALGYIARGSLGAGNTALQAISSFTDHEPGPEDGSLTEAVLAAYVEDGYQTTEQRIATANSERDCLAQAIYHEARGETRSGQLAVANVIVNRARSSRYPSTLCGVVYQNADKGRYRCQFTFACDGRSDVPTERAAWSRSKSLASEVYNDYALDEDLEMLPASALYYHTTAVRPSWANTFRRVAQIGAHIFYTPN